MTNKERVLSLIGFTPSNVNSIDGELVDLGLSSSGTYSLASSLQVKKCAIAVMKLLLTTPDTNNENGYVIKYDRSAVQVRIKELEDEVNGKVSDRPTISSPKVW